ncbi:hypothetical protein TWF281_011494 [Arthrobotrys megalospora]
MPTATSISAFEKEMDFLREQVTDRNSAIRADDKKKEEECDKKIEKTFERLSEDSTYPPSTTYSDKDRNQAKTLFRDTSSAYAKAPRQTRSTILLNLRVVLMANSGYHALTAVSAIAVTGIATLLVGSTMFIDGYGHIAEGSTIMLPDGGSTTLLDTNDNGIFDTVQNIDPSGVVTQGDLDLSDVVDLGVQVVAGVCTVM